MALDVDNSTINKKLQIIPDETEDNIINWLQNDVKKNVPKRKKVEPLPGCCIKAWRKNGDKAFVNLCHSNDLPPPDDISDEKFLELMTSKAPAFLIPMAIGAEKMAKDKANVERMTFDILINTKFFEKCMAKPLFLNFSVAAILEAVNDKYNKDINLANFVILQNRKVIGSLDTFNIEDRSPRMPEIKKPLIQLLDIPDDKEKKPKNIDTKFSYHPKINNYVILKSKDQDKLFGLFYLPSSTITDITVDIGDNRIIVENQKAHTIIDTFLPYSVDNDHITANFDSKLQILCLTLPLKNAS